MMAKHDDLLLKLSNKLNDTLLVLLSLDAELKADDVRQQTVKFEKQVAKQLREVDQQAAHTLGRIEVVKKKQQVKDGNELFDGKSDRDLQKKRRSGKKIAKRKRAPRRKRGE